MDSMLTTSRLSCTAIYPFGSFDAALMVTINDLTDRKRGLEKGSDNDLDSEVNFRHEGVRGVRL